MAAFAMITARGSNWQPACAIREQIGWNEHARFMDGLVDQGVIVLGGPIDSDRKDDVALLMVQAIDERQARSEFAEDPWGVSGVLRIRAVWPWTLWLDSRNQSPGQN